MTTCRICQKTSDHRSYVGREMMFGWREPFDYFECAGCGCVQIAHIPENLGKYYPDEYYSFQPPSRLKTLIKGPWLCDPFSLGTAFKRALALIPGVPLAPEWMRRARLKRDASILEVGSGNGSRLVAMRQAGYKDLTGVDPFIRADIRYSNGIQIVKKEIRELERPYDFIMLHHAFEHMPDPLQILKDVSRILKDDGSLLIRIPIASSFAWKTYGVNWPGMDPPRHLYIHTTGSLKLVADQAGFDIDDIFYDGDLMQFVGSEQYAHDIPLRDPRSYFENKHASMFSRAQVRAFKKQADRLNREKVGDSAAFYLRKKRAK